MKQDIYAHKQKFWQESIQKQRASGLSVKDWCQTYKIPTSRFLVWEKRLSIEPSTTTDVVFKPVKLKEEKTQVTITINGNQVTCAKEDLVSLLVLLK